MKRGTKMKLQYLGTAAAEGWPALFCTCDNCARARAAGGKNIRTRRKALPCQAVLEIESRKKSC